MRTKSGVGSTCIPPRDSRKTPKVAVVTCACPYSLWGFLFVALKLAWFSEDPPQQWTRKSRFSNRALVEAIFEAPECLKNSVFEASKLVSTKTLVLKHSYRHQGKHTLENEHKITSRHFIVIFRGPFCLAGFVIGLPGYRAHLPEKNESTPKVAQK